MTFMLRLYLLISLLFIETAPAVLADASRYYSVPNSRSPKGTYELALAVKSRQKVDWGKAAKSEDYCWDVLGEDQKNVECLLVRRKDMSLVQVVPQIKYWPAMRRRGEPRLSWSAKEDAFFVSMEGYWYTALAAVVRVGLEAPAGHADLWPLLKQSLDRYVRKHHAKFYRRKGYPYAWEPTKASFPMRGRLSLSLTLFVPKGASDWAANVRADIRLSKHGASVQNVKLLSLTPETSEGKL